MSSDTPAAAEAPVEKTADTPTCRCGHDRNHYMVSSETTYSIFGYLWLVVGVTVYPVRVRFRCRKCNQVFDSSTDPEVCKSFR